MDEVVIENIFPDSLDELTSAVSHETTTLSVPVWVPARNPTFKRIGEL